MREANANECFTNSNGVDEFDFKGAQGGEMQDNIMVYACMICRSIVWSENPAGGVRARLMDVIPVTAEVEAST